MRRTVSFPVIATGAYLALMVQALFTVMPEGLTLCPFRLLTGHACPGCGMGHALVYAWRGQWQASWQAHPLGLPLLILWSAWLVGGMIHHLQGREFSAGFVAVLRRPVYSWTVLALILITHAARSLL
jgi:hypothetical protein